MNGSKTKPTGYTLTRAFYAEVGENKDMQTRCTAHHHSLYTWICELSNRYPDREVYDLPRDYTMAMSFIGSPSTFKKCLDDLVQWGFIEIVQIGRNVWQPTKVCFSGSFLNKYCTASEQLMNSQRTANEQLVNTSKTIETNKLNKQSAPSRKSSKEEKQAFKELVLLTPSEHAKLLEEHGTDFVERCLTKLDAYKLANGKTYKSDCGAIRSWVIKAVQEEDEKRNRTGIASTNGTTKTLIHV